MALQAEIEARESSDEFEYEAIVEKVFYFVLYAYYLFIFVIHLSGSWRCRSGPRCKRRHGTVTD